MTLLGPHSSGLLNVVLMNDLTQSRLVFGIPIMILFLRSGWPNKTRPNERFTLITVNLYHTISVYKLPHQIITKKNTMY